MCAKVAQNHETKERSVKISGLYNRHDRIISPLDYFCESHLWIMQLFGKEKSFKNPTTTNHWGLCQVLEGLKSDVWLDILDVIGLVQSEDDAEAAVDTREAHEGQGEQSG